MRHYGPYSAGGEYDRNPRSGAQRHADFDNQENRNAKLRGQATDEMFSNMDSAVAQLKHAGFKLDIKKEKDYPEVYVIKCMAVEKDKLDTGADPVYVKIYATIYEGTMGKNPFDVNYYSFTDTKSYDMKGGAGNKSIGSGMANTDYGFKNNIKWFLEKFEPA